MTASTNYSIGKTAFYIFSGIALLLQFNASGQIGFSPITHNSLKESASIEAGQNLSHLLNSHQRSNADPTIIELSVPSGGQLNYCIDIPFLGEEFASMTDTECTATAFTSLVIEENCITIIAGNIGNDIQTDTICLQMEGTEGSLFDYILILDIRPVRSLPFVDDFSYSGPFPHPEYWTDKNVFVNYTFGKNPVSIGVATFDGLDKNGAPYGGGMGLSDVLTSTFIDLTEGIANQCFLTFYLQKGGNSYVPSSGEDILLEFKASDGEWVEINRYEASDFPDSDSFYFQQISVNPVYFYENFQFRFSNFNEGTGIQASWNLDYVKLANEFQSNLQFENDIAFTQLPSSVLEQYTAMPLGHFVDFEAQELASDLDIHLFNHFSGRRQADPSQLQIKEKMTGQILLTETLLEVPPVTEENQRDLDPGRHHFNNDIQNPADLLTAMVNLAQSAEDQLIIETQYTFQQNEEQIPELMRNNQVSRKTRLSDYYAYDDNTAELGMQITAGIGPLPSMAVRYRSNISDTLRGISINHPRVESGETNKRFRLKVWGASLEDEPIYRSANINPIYVDTHHDSLQGFTTYSLKSELTGRDTAIFIPAGDFHIGWTQVSRGSSGVFVGFDLNNPEKTKHAYWNNGAFWHPMEEVVANWRGALMIRPIFSLEQPITTSVVHREDHPEPLTLFPNPASNYLRILNHRTIAYESHYQILSINGAVLQQSRIIDKEIDISFLSPGTYILLIRDKEGKSHYGKFIKQ